MNSPWLIYEPTKPLKIKIMIACNLFFANNAILLCFFLFFLIIYFLYNSVTAYIFNPTAELAISTGTTTDEANAEIET